MDWKKFFGSEREEKDKHNFKKFDNEDDDDDDFSDLETFFNEFGNSQFGFKGFSPNILKQFSEILEAMEELNKNATDEQRLKMLERYNEFKEKKRDSDLDDKVYGEQLDALLKRISPDLMIKDDEVKNKTEIIVQQPSRKLTDEEIIMDKIHGTFKEEVRTPATRSNRKGNIQKAPISPHHHFGALPPFHEFPPSATQPNGANKSWNKTVISIRKSDGTYETRKLERSTDGVLRTTITKTDVDGNKSTQTFIGNDNDQSEKKVINSTPSKVEIVPHEERNFINQDGYKIPCLF